MYPNMQGCESVFVFCRSKYGSTFFQIYGSRSGSIKIDQNDYILVWFGYWDPDLDLQIYADSDPKPLIHKIKQIKIWPLIPTNLVEIIK